MRHQNPAKFVDLPNQERQKLKALRAADTNRFLSAAADNRYYVVFLIAVTTGMRPGEYLALRWKDIDFDTGTVSVQRALVTRGNSVRFQSRKTARSKRTVKLPPTALAALRTHRKEQAAQRLAAGPSHEDQDLVFAYLDGRPLDERNLVRRHFKPIPERTGLPRDPRLYDLRHTCATLLLQACKNPKVVSERLRHASVTLTLDTYSHVLPHMQQPAVDKLEEALFANQQPPA